MQSLAQFCMSLFLLAPLGEYVLHRAAHQLHIRYHLDHHVNWKDSRFVKYTGDWSPRVAGVLAAWQGCWLLAAMLLQYEISHTMAHVWNSAHHRGHHRRPGTNFGVSAAWPDKLFGTYYTRTTSE